MILYEYRTEADCKFKSIWFVIVYIYTRWHKQNCSCPELVIQWTLGQSESSIGKKHEEQHPMALSTTANKLILPTRAAQLNCRIVCWDRLSSKLPAFRGHVHSMGVLGVIHAYEVEVGLGHNHHHNHASHTSATQSHHPSLWWQIQWYVPSHIGSIILDRRGFLIVSTISAAVGYHSIPNNTMTQEECGNGQRVFSHLAKTSSGNATSINASLAMKHAEKLMEAVTGILRYTKRSKPSCIG